VYDAVLAETVSLVGHGGDVIEGYLARPLAAGAVAGVVVIHHMPGYDFDAKQITRSFAVHGYSALCPNLYWREAPGASPDDAAATVRAAGGEPDERCIGDVVGAARHLRGLSNASGKVGVIGFCSGGRQAYLVGCSSDEVDAVVDCYGGRVVAGPEELSERQPVAPISLTAQLGCPLLGLFGAEDRNPSPEHVARIEEELRRHGKDFELHSFEGAGHSFLQHDRPAYRPEAATKAWQLLLDFYRRHLGAPAWQPAAAPATR
jgi:carboxymethylenebutenolidase